MKKTRIVFSVLAALGFAAASPAFAAQSTDVEIGMASPGHVHPEAVATGAAPAAVHVGTSAAVAPPSPANTNTRFNTGSTAASSSWWRKLTGEGSTSSLPVGSTNATPQTSPHAVDPSVLAPPPPTAPPGTSAGPPKPLAIKDGHAGDAAPFVPPPPPTIRAIKPGECALAKDSQGVWRGPDGQPVDDAIAHIGDCRHKE